ncbi:hypothetical protein BRC89_07835 [Halobacteriales archaeon QS_4_70_19]|nr:MAG: hypothetical protein BRC89_07835 [Halobacteriales archaeon QS_4_70_19]
MANRLALLLLGGVLVTATVAGAAIGVYVGGDGPLLSSFGSDGGETGTPTVAATPTPTDGTDGSGGSTATATPTDNDPVITPTTPAATSELRTVPASEFNESRIAELVGEEINDRRRARGQRILLVDDVLARMATNHSRRMSQQGYVSHAAGGYTTEERYRRNDRYEECQLPNDDNTATQAGHELETLRKVSAGAPFDGQTNRDEREVAQDAVGDWFAKDAARKKLTYEAAGDLGVGVEVTANNRAYITVDVC